MYQPSLFAGFAILYALFSISVLIAVTLTAATQPQLGFWATFKAAFKLLDRVLTASLVLAGGFILLFWVVIWVSRAAH